MNDIIVAKFINFNPSQDNSFERTFGEEFVRRDTVSPLMNESWNWWRPLFRSLRRHLSGLTLISEQGSKLQDGLPEGLTPSYSGILISNMTTSLAGVNASNNNNC